MKKGISVIYILVIILAVFLVAGGSYYAGNQRKPKVIPQPTPEPKNEVTTAPTVDETATLKTFIKNALVAKHGSTANELNISVSKIEGGFASGGASGEGEGGMWFAAKVDGNWQLVWDGNGVILCKDLVAYPNFPAGMIPECYNEQTNKSVKR